MIRGRVDSLRQARVQVEVARIDGTFEPIGAIVDTGFDGHLALPPEFIGRLNMEPDWPTYVDLETGLRERMNTWRGYVLWHDGIRSIRVLEAGGPPLLGMELMEDSQLTMQPRINGPVLIERLNETNT